LLGAKALIPYLNLDDEHDADFVQRIKAIAEKFLTDIVVRVRMAAGKFLTYIMQLSFKCKECISNVELEIEEPVTEV
jgi:hypothetical protein